MRKLKSNKTVCIKLRFWTNNVEVIHGGKKSLACWDSGMAILEHNLPKGIGGLSPQPFQCFEDIVPLLKEIFRKQNILVVSSNRRPRIMNPKRRSK